MCIIATERGIIVSLVHRVVYKLVALFKASVAEDTKAEAATLAHEKTTSVGGSAENRKTKHRRIKRSKRKPKKKAYEEPEYGSCVE